MAITFVGNADQPANGSTEGTSLTISKPAGVQSGDVLVAHVSEWDGWAASNYTPPSGWSQIDHWDDAAGAGTGSLGMTTWYRVAGASEPASYTWSSSKTSLYWGAINAYRGVDNAAPVDKHGVAGGDGAVSTFSPPSVTTTYAGDQLVLCFAGNYAQGSTPTIAAPSGATQRSSSDNSGVGTAAGETCDESQAAAGATGTLAATFSTSGQNAHAGAIVALKAAAAGGAAGPYPFPTELRLMEWDF